MEGPLSAPPGYGIPSENTDWGQIASVDTDLHTLFFMEVISAFLKPILLGDKGQAFTIYKHEKNGGLSENIS